MIVTPIQWQRYSIKKTVMIDNTLWRNFDKAGVFIDIFPYGWVTRRYTGTTTTF